ncbi:MAG: D-tyrosyl-tRNA(Tyr) deacylase [Ignavibacteria bacterium]|nr:D-tyrosyl-tRNA(Tyr) deacylase [Ignavibacteria bacterium]
MRALVQRVERASVKIDGKFAGNIAIGLLVYIGIAPADNIETIKWMCNKLVNLRIFPDEENKMNRSVIDCNGEILMISNFTLYGDVHKGFRPNFMASAAPDIAENIYNKLVDYLRNNFPIKVATGRFGAMMDIESVGAGPVNIIIDA